MHPLFIRVGCLGEVRVARSSQPVPRGRRVLVRTPRGVELAEVLGNRRAWTKADSGALRGSSAGAAPWAESDRWTILRPTTPEDEWLIDRLEQPKRQAVEECRRSLEESGSNAVLLDVDQLFDGGTLLLHFLGDIDAQAEEITQQVAKRYESIVRTEQIANLLDEGCGPDCGTEAATGCGTGCGGCAARIVCHTQ